MYTVMEYVIVNTILFTAIPPGGRERERVFFFMYTVMEYVIVNTILFTTSPRAREREREISLFMECGCPFYFLYIIVNTVLFTSSSRAREREREKERSVCLWGVGVFFCLFFWGEGGLF